MKIEIKYENEILKSYSKKPISIKDIILNIKRKYNIKKEEILLVFNSKNNEIYEETDLLIPNEKEKNQIESLNIIKINNKKNIININNNNKPKENEPIEDLIMKITGASTKLKSQTQNPENSYNILERLGRENPNLGFLFEMLQNLEQRNLQIQQIRQINRNNQPIEVDENLVNQLKDMGFTEDRARQALRQCRNNIERATEILLDNV
jgi:uncharacterized UBP type Zn finger protein